jgi:hypothetical protein
MNPKEDEELEAMLAAAEVKEDFLDLGMPGIGEGAQSITDSPSREDKLAARRMIGTFSNGKKYKVKSVDGESNMCMSYIGSGATFCLRENCTTNHGNNSSGEGESEFAAPEGGVLVILKNNQVAFAAPTLRASAVVGRSRWKIGSKCFEPLTKARTL